MQRNKAIDAVKGFAILLVMVGHCIVLNGLNTTDPYIYDIIKSIQMPLFMLVSGVLAGMSALHKSFPLSLNAQTGDAERVCSGSRISQLGRTIGKRAQSYLLPFFSWFVLVYLYTHILAGTLSVSGFFTELKQLLFQTDRGLWFLTTLFVVTLMVMLADLVADLVSGNRELSFVCFLAVSVLLYGLFFLQSRSGNSFLSPSLTLQYFPFYFLGYIGSRYALGNMAVQKLVKQTKFVMAGNGLLLLLLAAFLYLVVRYDLNAPVTGMGALLLQMSASGLGTLVCFFGVYEIASYIETGRAQKSDRENKGILSFIGVYTLEIYVLHFRFARLLHLADKNLQFYSLKALGWLIASFALMSLLTFVCIFLLKRVWILDLLLFGKKPSAPPAAGADKPSPCTSSDKNTG